MLRRLPALILLAFAAPLAAEPVRLQAPGDIAEFLAPYLPEAPAADPAARAETRRRLQKSLPELLATEGYFGPRIEFSEQDDALVVAIDPGPRTRVADVEVHVAGPLDEAERRAAVASWTLPAGRPFRQAEWSAAKQDLLARLIARGHAGASLTGSLADIEAEAAAAHLYASYEAGPPYRFGELKVEGLSRYSPELVARYNRSVHPGDPYREERLAALQNALQSTPYFSSVQVELERDAASPEADGSVSAPVRVLVSEKAPRRLAFGVGASSNTGARVETNYGDADFLHRAWELNGGLRLEQKRQIAYADVFLPPDRLAYRHSFGTVIEHSDIQGLSTERLALGAQRQQQRGALHMLLALNWQEERRRPEGAPATLNRALVPDSQWTWRQVDSLIDPRDGVVLQARVGGAGRALLSDRDFLRLYGRYQQFFPLGRSNVLTLRGELGYTAARSRQGIPQDYLFRAGGTHSVRGYSYQSLGVREGDAVVGGRVLATASAELTHWLDERWGVAAFVDAGDAADHPGALSAAVGAGLGARWKSPAGPVAVDLAYAERTRHPQLHFSLAIPF